MFGRGRRCALISKKDEKVVLAFFMFLQESSCEVEGEEAHKCIGDPRVVSCNNCTVQYNHLLISINGAHKTLIMCNRALVGYNILTFFKINEHLGCLLYNKKLHFRRYPNSFQAELYQKSLKRKISILRRHTKKPVFGSAGCVTHNQC